MAYEADTQYVSNDDYKNTFGVDISYEFKTSSTDDPSRKVNNFLQMVQFWTYQYLISHFDFNDDNWNDTTFKTALLWQVRHTMKYGEDDKLDNTCYSILHEAGIINPSREDRIYRYY